MKRHIIGFMLILAAGVTTTSACQPDRMQAEMKSEAASGMQSRVLETGQVPLEEGVVPEVTRDAAPGQPLSPAVSSAEAARDAAFAYGVGAYAWPAPSGWMLQPARIEDGLVVETYTAEGWVVQVSAPPSAPYPGEYRVIVDHIPAITRWEGLVDAQGAVLEIKYVQGQLAGQPDGRTGEDVDGWVGLVVSNPAGSQFDDYFQLMGQEDARIGIAGADESIGAQLAGYRDSGIAIRVWGTVSRDVPDAYGSQILVTRLEQEGP